MLVVRSFQLCDFLVRRNALNCLRLFIFVFVHQDIFHFLFTPRELTLVLSSMNPHDRFTLLFKEEMDAPDPIPDLNKVRDRGEGVTVSGRAHSPHTSLYALPIVRYYPLSYIRTYVPGTGVLEEHDEVMDGDLTPLHQARLIGMSDDATLNVTSKPESAPSEDSATIVPYRSTVSSDAKVPLSFTPALALAHFPYKHLRGDLAKRISQEFYEGGKFWQRTWDLYYLSVPKAVGEGSLLLIPVKQAFLFIEEINSTLKSSIRLTGTGREGMMLSFDNDKIPLPIFLGESNSVGKKDELVQSIPSSQLEWGTWSDTVQAAVVEAFEASIRRSFDMIRKKSAKRVAQQVKRKRDAEESLGRAMAFFGLRPLWAANTHQPSFVNGEIQPIDPLRPVKWAFQDSPIFICVDVEWNERQTWQLTEVGISTLDTMDLEGVVPGDYGEMWAARIRSRHLRVDEYRHWVNTEFCMGCPGSFDFGQSEIVSSGDVGQIVDKAFKPPYMIPTSKDPVQWWKLQKRNIVLVGLDMKGDIQQLKSNGSRVFLDYDTPRSIIHDTLDLADLYRAESGEIQNRGLVNVLRSLQVLHVNLHNGGNDAHYTLHGLIRVMMKTAGEKAWAYEKEGGAFEAVHGEAQ